jgi:hypothetical protein
VITALVPETFALQVQSTFDTPEKIRITRAPKPHYTVSDDGDGQRTGQKAAQNRGLAGIYVKLGKIVEYQWLDWRRGWDSNPRYRLKPV